MVERYGGLGVKASLGPGSSVRMMPCHDFGNHISICGTSSTKDTYARIQNSLRRIYVLQFDFPSNSSCLREADGYENHLQQHMLPSLKQGSAAGQGWRQTGPALVRQRRLCNAAAHLQVHGTTLINLPLTLLSPCQSMFQDSLSPHGQTVVKHHSAAPCSARRLCTLKMPICEPYKLNFEKPASCRAPLGRSGVDCLRMAGSEEPLPAKLAPTPPAPRRLSYLGECCS